MKSTKIKVKSFLLLLTVFAIGVTSLVFLNQALAAISGAIFTSLGNGMTVNQNLYDNKADVYLNGGPQNLNAAGLPVGRYYFQVTDPSGGVLLSTDNAVCRQLEVVPNSNGKGVIYGASPASGMCAHLNGTQNMSNGSIPVQLLPYNDTPNNGGEYKVHLIRQTGTTSIDANDPRVINFQSSNSKTDNFKVRNFCQLNPDDPSCSPDTTVSISGTKFYDSDADGVRDLGEVGFAGIRIEITFTPPLALEPNPVMRTTDSSGNWSVDGIPLGTSYAVREILPPPCMNGTYWRQTAPAAPGTYSGTVGNTNVTGLDFGDLCFRPARGGLTLGFWSNKNGQAIMKSTDNFASALLFLRNLPLKTTRTGNVDFDPTNYPDFRTWLLNGNAVNMAYMLSVQLAATSLDVRYNLLSDAQIVDTTDYNDPLNPLDDDPRIGFASIGFVRQQAILLLTIDGYTPSGDPNRVAQELYKDILDDINNNRLPFASTTPCTDEICYPLPTPTPTP